ncbi:MAG TPA: monovalent cation/H(+) antiporter subunit G [Peptococcaceae bacterium]|nr:Na+/H+ antiporter subunit G [Clostridia bacterium]HOB82268.1 monovalent cation/H(+) antiporter subunit G [Peptococcaceae bacterium]HPZ70772.1 monovalent cation/H(+) antiporter subunit G [Peptococcaceae bacterium]HQD54042.1 monovalent cation/H(+) antiporter subunit G [Peptococcaceae bacterium]
MSAGHLIELGSVFLILIGTVAGSLSAIGFIRLPDVYNRAHALAKSCTLGVLFVLLGTFLFFLFVERYFSIKLFLGIFFVFLTSPVAAHMTCRAAYRSKVPLAEISVRDDLKEAMSREYNCEQKGGA